ncbi:hypothetical protein C9374_007040 [Naegleria lovaniensis]|uniref:Uncharacterized protein n=1 Tax=Naegleria lovaniensis TaxID=51637 RepID=A0AA88GZL3_NAELO|nr:uncharacterized protein C9374_007040 [Naegleria lovaniensis]KAG2393509.1 hypothetical protein C9374_007040 [Naegleria lovaniensis]
MTKTAKQKIMWQTIKALQDLKQGLFETEKKLRSSLGFKVLFIAGMTLVGYLPYELRKVYSEKQPSIFSLMNKEFTRTEEKKEAMKRLFGE